MAIAAEDFEELLIAFQQDIPTFVEVMFGWQLRPFQVEFARALQQKPLITFKGGAGPGKTFTMSALIWWALICHNDVKVIVLGPNEAQIKQGLWNELGKFHEAMKLRQPLFHAEFEWTATKIERKSNPSTCSARFMLADKDNTAKVRGIHSANTFVFVDEASGVADEVLLALMNTNNDSPSSRLCLISNPEHASGFFYDTWEDQDKRVDWHHLTATMRDDPNKTEEMIARFTRQVGGVTSRKYRTMVLGEFPTDSEDSMIAASHVEEAMHGVHTADPHAPLTWGVDIGGGRDRTVLIARKGNWVSEPRTWNYADTTQTAFAISEAYAALPTKERPVEIMIDAIGIGAGVFYELKRMGLPVKGIKVSNKPTRRPDDFSRLRDQLWWELKEWLEAGSVRLPNHDELRREISLPRYDEVAGKIKVEGKDELRKRGRGSPDYADALCLTFAGSGIGRFSGKYAWGKSIPSKRAHLS